MVERRGSVEAKAAVADNPADQRIAVGMDARRGDADQHVARLDPVTGQLLAAFHRPDRKAGQVIVALCIHARHFCRFAANQRASGDATTISNSGDDARGDIRRKAAGCKIVQKKQRFGTLYDQVIDAHCHQINSDGIMSPGFNRQFQLGPNSIGCRNQQRILETGGFWIEETAKAADFGIGSGAGGGTDQRRNGADQRIAGGY